MWVIYHKTDLKILGLSAHGDPDLEKGFAIEEMLQGMGNPGPREEYDAIQVTDLSQVLAYMRAFPDRLFLRQGPGGALQLVVETPKVFLLRLSCDAPDVHPADGIPEIPANGDSFTTITVQKVDEAGAPQEGKGDADLLYLRTDWGSLWSADGKEEINSLKLKKGQAAFRLVSEKARRVATVQVFNAEANLQNASIRIEFI
jgi:hypothetical protein